MVRCDRCDRLPDSAMIVVGDDCCSHCGCVAWMHRLEMASTRPAARSIGARVAMPPIVETDEKTMMVDQVCFLGMVHEGSSFVESCAARTFAPVVEEESDYAAHRFHDCEKTSFPWKDFSREWNWYVGNCAETIVALMDEDRPQIQPCGSEPWEYYPKNLLRESS